MNDEKISLVEMINKVGKTINGLPSDLHSPLMISVHCEQIKIVEYLLSLKEIDLSITNNSDMNVFHYAALNEHNINILKRAFKYNAVTVKGKYGVLVRPLLKLIKQLRVYDNVLQRQNAKILNTTIHSSYLHYYLIAKLQFHRQLSYLNLLSYQNLQ